MNKKRYPNWEAVSECVYYSVLEQYFKNKQEDCEDFVSSAIGQSSKMSAMVQVLEANEEHPEIRGYLIQTFSAQLEEPYLSCVLDYNKGLRYNND